MKSEQHKDEIITLTEQVIDAKGIECDSKISKISEEQLSEILEGVKDFEKERRRLGLKKMVRITGKKKSLIFLYSSVTNY